MQAQTLETTAEHVEATSRIVVPAALLEKALSSVKHAVADQKDRRYYLNGIYMVRTEEDSLIFVATDGNRLAEYSSHCEHLPPFPSVILPIAFVTELVKAARNKDNKRKHVAMQVSRLNVEATFNNGTISSKTIDGTFPNWEKVKPRNPTLRASFLVDDLMKAIALVASCLIADGRIPLIKITISEEKCTIEATLKLGTVTMETPCKCETPYVFGMNALFVRSVLRTLQENSHVQLSSDDAESPHVFCARNDNNLYNIIMPMRI